MSLIEAAVMQAGLGDTRRNERAMLIVASIVQGQTSDTNATPGTGRAAPWAHSMASFRLYNNESVTLPALYGAVKTALAELVPKTARVYVAHDFSVVDYTKHNDKKDRVQVGNEAGMGYDLYAALVLDESGQPLGPLVTELRNASGCLSSESAKTLKFVDHYEQVERGIAAASKHLPGRECVHVMDREFDDVALQRFLDGSNGLYVIRAQHIRRIVRHAERAIPLEEAVRTIHRRRSGEVEREGQRYERWVGETTVTFERPSWRGRKRGAKRRAGAPIAVRIVVTELRGIGHKKHHEWVLLTNVEDPIENVVEAYLARWRIERFFYLTKVGLRLEQWRQETGEATARRLALTMLAAMAIYQLLVAKDEPSVRAIATLGGWLGRKNDSLGPVVMMRGALILVAGLCAVAQHGVDGLVRMATEAGLGFAVPQNLRGARSS
jgi:hypothetical protein